jgi:hypothetical protein
MHVYKGVNNKPIHIFQLQKSIIIYLMYICCNFFNRCLLQVDNLNLVTNLKNYCFYAMLIACKCTPFCKKLDCNTKSESPYLATTSVLEWNNHFVWKDGVGVHWRTTRSCSNEDWSLHCDLFKKMGVAQGLFLTPRKESHNSLGEKARKVIIDLIFHRWKRWVRNFQNMSSLAHSKCG